MNYQENGIRNMMDAQMSHLRLGRQHPYNMGQQQYGNPYAHRTPMPVRVQNLMENGLAGRS